MTFYAQLLRTHQLLSKRKKKKKTYSTLSILYEIKHFYVCPSTIETRFYPDTKPEKTQKDY